MKPRLETIPQTAACLCWLASLLTQNLLADPLDHWHWRNPLPYGNPIFSVAYGSSRFVAVGWLGTISTSSDGVQWHSPPSVTLDHFSAVAYGSDTFVAVRNAGMTFNSNDGTHWTKRDAGTKDDLGAITYANGMFVAMGNGGYSPVGASRAFFTSTNGLNWTAHLSVVLNTCVSIGPELGIVRSNNTATVSWPFQPTGFVLESATSLGPPNWQPAVEAPMTNNGLLDVAVPLNQAGRYFRLRKP